VSNPVSPIGGIRQIGAEEGTPVPIPTITGCLRQLASLCRVVADRSALLPSFLRIIAMAPETLVALQRGGLRRAA
jgi:hypothetical protein